MPKVLSFTPAWLSAPAPGHDIFSPTFASNSKAQYTNGSTNVSAQPSAKRLVARRGSEVFVAVGREIRWACLIYLKEHWEREQQLGNERQSRSPENETEGAKGYRVIRVPVSGDIKQLIISPQSNYLAVLTTHTIHIAVLPESSHLTSSDTSAMRLRTYTLGPTVHVTSQPAIAAALWHPLGVNGTCLVTVTKDATVRLWELSLTDRWSFDRPTMAIDLTKLADGTSLDQDFGASAPNMRKGFSPDSVEMEVASACFAGRGSGGWSPMTLWVAMREGDVYALCPLLPEKWSPPPTLIPSLSVSIVSKVAATEDDPAVPDEKKRLTQQQLAWMSGLDNQEPMLIEAPAGEPPTEVYTRPTKPGKVPKLQGPFEIELAPESHDGESELVTMLSDILVIGPKIDSDQLMSGEAYDLDTDEGDHEGLSVCIVCLLSSSGRMTICLDLAGVEAQWLPQTNQKQARFMEANNPPELLTYEALETIPPIEMNESSWPTFSPDFGSRYSFFVTTATNITFFSLTSWVFRLQSELLGDTSAGADFRLDLLVQGDRSTRQKLLKQMPESPLSTCTCVTDPDIGYFIFTVTAHGPFALFLESPEDAYDSDHRRSGSPSFDDFEQDLKPLVLNEPRPVYQPSHLLSQPSPIPDFLSQLRKSKWKLLLNQDIKLSPATLNILTSLHKLLSRETHQIGIAVAELFRKCERLTAELSDQVKRVNEIKGRIKIETGTDCSDDDYIEDNDTRHGEKAVMNRLLKARDKQAELADRVEILKKKVMRGGGSRHLTEKERAWADELEGLEKTILPGTMGDSDEGLVTGRRRPAAPLWRRFEEVKSIKEDLIAQIEDAKTETESTTIHSPGAARSGIRVPNEIRRKKVEEVMKLLEREEALVDATKGRLERLTLE